MRYKPRRMQVEVDRDASVSAKTVGELRKVTVWPENLVITTPQERRPESAIRVSKAGERNASPQNRNGATHIATPSHINRSKKQ